MMYNKNHGFGRSLFDNAPFIAPNGKVFIVGASTLANIQMVREAFGPDPEGKIRYYTTVDSAISACTANANDLIIVLPGHTETVTATSIAFDVAGVTVLCMGNGGNAPTFTYSTADATITVTGANCTWKGGNFVGNYDNVAAAFTIGAAVNFRLEGGNFTDSSNALHFLSIVVTGATNNQADGLTVVNNSWYGLALAPNAFISILANENHVLIADNNVNMAATNDVGHFVTFAAKVVLNFRCLRNMLRVTGATNAAVGIFLTGSSTTNNGVVANNYVDSLDVTSPLLATAGTKLSFFENYYPVAADKNGALLPANS